MRTLLRKAVAASVFPPALVLSLVAAQATPGHAQTQTQPEAPTRLAAIHDLPRDGASAAVRDGGSTSNPTSGALATPDPEISPAVAKELAAMKAEIEQLKAELKGHA